MNLLILCMGVMYGVVGANNALKAVAKALGTGVEKQLLRRALTKGTIYPIVKSVSKWFGVRMTKQIFAGVFKKLSRWSAACWAAESPTCLSSPAAIS